MKAWISAVLLAALALSLVAPDAGAAPRGWQEQPRSLRLSFEAKASNGYRISVETAGHKQVTVRLAKGGTSALYRTTGRVSRTGIEADLGALGEIAIEFRGRPVRLQSSPSRKKSGLRGRLPRRKCHGRKPQLEVGTFHGTIRFEGENGFARFDRDRVKGTMQRTYRRLCKAGPRLGFLAAKLDAVASAAKKPKRDAYMTFLVATGELEGRRVAFVTLGFDGTTGDPLLDDLLGILGRIARAVTSERRDGVLIQREGISFGSEGSLIVSPPKRKQITATVAYPKPFEGTGEYQQTPGSPPSWIGSLVARLPGAGAVPMTGSGLTTVFCQVSFDLDADADQSCFREAQEALSGVDVARVR